VITLQRLHHVFDVDVVQGTLIWRNPPTIRVKAGALAGTTNGDGYLQVSVDKEKYYVHRLIWFAAHGVFIKSVDHHNEIRNDNRIGNLRDASKAQNMCNRGKNANNKSGFKGVYWQRGKWVATICTAGKRQYLGRYVSPADAHAAYCAAAAIQHGAFYHP
jgi:hypothetical protein